MQNYRLCVRFSFPILSIATTKRTRTVKKATHAQISISEAKLPPNGLPHQIRKGWSKIDWQWIEDVTHIDSNFRQSF